MENNVYFACCSKICGKTGKGFCGPMRTPEQISGKVKGDFEELMKINRDRLNQRERRKNES